MNTHEIELPAEFRSGNDIPVTQATIKRERMEEILRAAIEADRQQRHLKEESQIEREWVHLRAMQAQYEADRKRRGEPTAAEISDVVREITGCPDIKSGEKSLVVALGMLFHSCAAPQPAEPVKEPSDEHLIETGCYQTVIERHSQPVASAEPFAVLAVEKNGSVSVFANSTALSERPIDDEDRQWAASRQAQLVEVYAAPVAAQAQKWEGVEDPFFSPESMTGLGKDELIRQLQWALNYWMPSIAGDGTPDGERCANDSYLLYGMKTPVGREGDNTPSYWEKQQPSAQDRENAGDPLQGAANWLLEVIENCRPVDLQNRLFIGYNRASRLIDAARAAKGQS